jgi:hypothetical protein
VENNRDAFRFPDSAPKEGGRPVALIVELMQQTKDMQHVDEVLFWLSDAMVRYLNISVVQFWVSQKYDTGQVQVEPRASASLHRSLPQQVHINVQVAGVVEHLLREQHGIMPLPVTNVFPLPQANWLSQYHLCYWSCYFVKSDLFAPPAIDKSIQGKIATPLRMAVSLFTENFPSQHLLRATDFVLKQSVTIITDRKLLSSVPFATADLSHTKPLLQAQITLSDIIPDRTQNIELLQASNPLANAPIISDRNARRLYAIIDGQKNVVELAQMAHLDTLEMINALLHLVQQRHIQLRDQQGKPIESSLLLSLR